MSISLISSEHHLLIQRFGRGIELAKCSRYLEIKSGREREGSVDKSETGNVFVGALVHIGSESWSRSFETDLVARMTRVPTHIIVLFLSLFLFFPFFVANCASLCRTRPSWNPRKLRSLRKNGSIVPFPLFSLLDNRKHPTLNCISSFSIYHLGIKQFP